jgi:4-carboxymuconolactone decarboxylase
VRASDAGRAAGATSADRSRGSVMPTWKKKGVGVSELYEAGLRVRKEVLGEAYVETSLGNADSFNREFQEFITAYGWGGVWARPGLSRKQRSLNNLCMLAALNRPNEFKLHLRGAFNNDCTVEEIKETLFQITVYCGGPAGVEGFRLAREVIEELGIEIEK